MNREAMTMRDIAGGKYDRELQIKLVHMDPFINRVDRLKKTVDEDGTRTFSDEEIADFFGMTVDELNIKMATRLAEERKKINDEIDRLKTEGKNQYEIAIHIGRMISEAKSEQIEK